jgi:hypothetical protein
MERKTHSEAFSDYQTVIGVEPVHTAKRELDSLSRRMKATPPAEVMLVSLSAYCEQKRRILPNASLLFERARGTKRCRRHG